MSKDFIVTDDYVGYVYVGHAQGNMEQQDGTKKPWFHMYVISPVSTYQSEDYSAFGFKAEKKPCVSADVWKGLDCEPGTRVKLFFDDKQKVIMAVIDQ